MASTIDPDELIDSQEVADLLGLSHRNSVSTYVHRYADFPAPAVERGAGRTRLWLRGDVDAWGRARRGQARPSTGGRASGWPAAPLSVGVLGYGLIGSSIGRALVSRRHPAIGPVACWDLDAGGEPDATRRGITWAADPEALVDGSDVIVVCVPMAATGPVLDRVLDHALGSGRTKPLVLTEVSSTKGDLPTKAATQLRGQPMVQFLSSHPMAGDVRTGFTAGDPNLFEGATWALCPTDPADPTGIDAAVAVAAVALATGARVVAMSPTEHDRVVAVISQLPLLLAVAQSLAVGASPDQELLRLLAAGGFRDSTRVAGASPELSTGMIATQPGPVVEAASAATSQLASLLDLIERSRWAELEGSFAAAQALQAEWRSGPATEAFGQVVDREELVVALLEATAKGLRLERLTIDGAKISMRFQPR